LIAEVLLEELTGRGVALKVTPQGNIRCRPKGNLAPEHPAMIKEHKQDLIRILKSTDQSIVPSPPSPPSPARQKADTYRESAGDNYGDGIDEAETTVPSLPDLAQQKIKHASELGLVARWSYEFGFISIHDPASGEWYGLETKDAPDWAKRECFKRKELRKFHGITGLLTRAEMEDVWLRDQAEMWDEPYRPADAVDGLIYE